MNPSLPIPTDNIYKFACLFGLTLIVTSIFSFVAVYSSSLDKKMQYYQAVVMLEAKVGKTVEDNEILKLNKRMLEVTKGNEGTANTFAGGVIALGVIISLWGASKWHSVIQLRDDRLANLQIDKLEAEIAKLRSEKKPAS
jgi:F420-0:gamma-glutamyl ligase-like protein